MPPASYPTSMSLEDSITLPPSGLHPAVMAMDPNSGESRTPKKERYPLPTSELYPTEDNGGPSRIKANCNACIKSITKKFVSFLNATGRSTVNAIEAATLIPVIEGIDVENKGPAGQGSAEKSREGVTECSSADDHHPQSVEMFKKQLGEVKWLSASTCIDMIGKEAGYQFEGENGVDGKVRAGLEESLANLVSRYENLSFQEGDGNEGSSDVEGYAAEALDAEAVVIKIVNLLDGEGYGYLEVIEGECDQDYEVSHCGEWNEGHSL